MTGATFAVRVGGPYACFTRPEFKVERVSYPVMTPSAARGLLESVFWKPEFRWEIREIQVLKPIQQTALMRNELSERQGQKPFCVEDKGKRQQRASLILTDVDYVIKADVVMRPHAHDPITKYIEMFQRRLERGQHHHTPFLGTREFSASYVLPAGNESPVPLNLDLGHMLFDIAYIRDKSRDELHFRRHSDKGGESVRGYSEAQFFHAMVADGVLIIPPHLYRELSRREGMP